MVHIGHRRFTHGHLMSNVHKCKNKDLKFNTALWSDLNRRIVEESIISTII